MKRALAALSVLLVAACGRAVPPASQASAAAAGQHPSPTPSAHSATATFDLLPPSGTVPAIDLQISCNRPIGASDSVAIVQLHDGSTVLRDYADAGHPYTACSFGANRSVTQLIDAHHLVVPSQGCTLFAVVDLPEARPHWFQLPRQSECPTLLAIAPGLDAVAWMSPDLPSNSHQIHLTTHAGDHIVASLPNPHGGRCGSADDSKSASYTQSGSHLFVLDQPYALLNSLLVVEREHAGLRIAPDTRQWTAGAQPEMAVWSPTSETLHYRKDGDVWSWTPASGSQKFLPGVSWYYPTISPDGKHLAFAELQQDGFAHRIDG